MQPAADTHSPRARAPRFARPESGSGRTPAPAISVLGGWQLARHIATGEHAALYQARPVTLPSDAPADYLVKVALQHSSGVELAAALLRREKTVARSVRHSHLPAVLASNLRNEPPYLVLASPGTAALGIADQRHSLQMALWRARQTAAALAALHQAGWIHARLTPAALLVSQRGHVTLCELGWARQIGTAECRGDHLLAADLRYVAPEMLCDGTVLTPACDVYCLGLLLIELLVGRPAVNANVGWQAALAHLRGELTDVRAFRADVPHAFVDLLSRMTSREPLRRPSAAEIERQLVRLEVSQLSGARPSRTTWR